MREKQSSVPLTLRRKHCASAAVATTAASWSRRGSPRSRRLVERPTCIERTRVDPRDEQTRTSRRKSAKDFRHRTGHRMLSHALAVLDEFGIGGR